MSCVLISVFMLLLLIRFIGMLDFVSVCSMFRCVKLCALLLLSIMLMVLLVRKWVRCLVLVCSLDCSE